MIRSSCIAAILLAGAAEARAACDQQFMTPPGLPTGSYSVPVGQVLVDGAPTESPGIIEGDATIVTGEDGSVVLAIADGQVPVGPDAIVCITRTGPDICVQIGDRNIVASCEALAAVPPAPTPPVPAALPLLILGGVGAAVALGGGDGGGLGGGDEPASQ